MVSPGAPRSSRLTARSRCPVLVTIRSGVTEKEVTPLETRAASSIGLCAMSLASLVVAFGLLKSHVVLKWVWALESPFVVAYSSFVFVTARRLFENHSSRLVSRVSARSFGIYITHPLLLNLLYKGTGWAQAPLPPLLFELMTFAMVFLGSYALSCALARIPFFSWMRF